HAKLLCDSDRKGHDASRRPTDQDLFSCFQPAGVAQALQRNKRGRDRRGLLEVNVGRLRHHRSARLDTNVFGERACLYSEDFVARLELGYVPAGSLNCSGVVRARAGVFWFAKSEEESARDAASQHATVEKSEGDGANPDEKLVVAWN